MGSSHRILLLPLLAAAALIVGCGSSSSSSGSSASTSSAASTSTSPATTPTSASTSTSTTPTSSTGSGASPTGANAVAACKRGVASLPHLKRSTVERLEKICEKAGSDANAQRQAAEEACRELVNASPLPAGEAKERALAACKNAGGTKSSK